MSDIVYNTIGNGYNSTRRADPYIADCLYRLLAPQPAERYLDIGCGTGNYLAALQAKGMAITGADPSALMLETARRNNPGTEFVCTAATALPFPDETFGGAMAVLTFHHWQERQQSLAALHRVLRPGGRLVFFTFTPEQVRYYWLAHYFPKMIGQAAATIPGTTAMNDLLTEAGFDLLPPEPYFVRDDLQDHFMYAHKSRPEQYLDPRFRDGVSGFRLAQDQQEIEQGLVQLQADIASGHIRDIIGHHAYEGGDYLFLAAVRR